jgi:2-phospho-L-lactate guanylyltransferase
MNLWLIVPVKPLQQSKSRLATVLTPPERAALMRHLLQHVLQRAQAASLFAEILVVSRDAEVWALAHLSGASVLHEQGQELNWALDQARGRAIDQGADAILVLPADLPMVTVEDLHRLAALAGQADVAIAPSQGGGTNALLLHPPDAIPFAFGPDSFRQHCALAQASAHRLQVYRSESLAFDVDLPEDWVAIRAGIGTLVHSACTPQADR